MKNLLAIKDDSLKHVLRLIRQNREISGAALARLSSFQPSTITYILRKLQKPGIIEQAGMGESTGKGGKKPTLWKITSRKYYIIGIEVLPTKARYIVADIDGDIIQQSEVKQPKMNGIETLSRSISGLIEQIIVTCGYSAVQFVGAGIAFPGLVDSLNGRILYSSSLRISNYHVLEDLDGRNDVSMYVSNDANAAALTVPWYGSSNGREHPENYVYLLYTQGAENLGSGLFINGRLFEGYSGTAGEIFTPLPSIDHWISKGRNQGLQWTNVKLEKNKVYEIGVLINEAKKGCSLAGYAVEKLMHFIADEMIRIVGFLNPEEIILGGELVHGAWLIENYLNPYLKKKSNHLLSLGYQLPGISYSEYGKYSVSMGATALILNQILS